jgi:hypothetical protein
VFDKSEKASKLSMALSKSEDSKIIADPELAMLPLI